MAGRVKMKHKTRHLSKETLQKIYDESVKDCQSIQYLIDKARSRLRNRDIPRRLREEARILYCISKAFQDIGDSWYDDAIQRLETAIGLIKREYIDKGKGRAYKMSMVMRSEEEE